MGPRWRHLSWGLLATAVSYLMLMVGTVVVLDHIHPEWNSDTLSMKSDEWLTIGPGLLLGMVSLWIGMGVAVWMAGHATEGGWRAIIPLKVTRRDLWLGTWIGVVAQVAVTVLGSLLLALSSGKETNLGNTNVVFGSSGGWMLALAFAAVFIAPLFEEAMFRGLLLQLFMRRMGLLRAVFITSNLFGAMHLNTAGGPIAATFIGVGTACAGAVFAWVRVKSNSVGAAMFAHLVFNAFGLVWAVLVPAA